MAHPHHIHQTQVLIARSPDEAVFAIRSATLWNQSSFPLTLKTFNETDSFTLIAYETYTFAPDEKRTVSAKGMSFIQARVTATGKKIPLEGRLKQDRTYIVEANKQGNLVLREQDSR